MKNKIVVNATSLRSGGALTILQQFIAEVPDDNMEYVIFVNDLVLFSNFRKNVQMIQISTTSFFKRFIWDAIGLNSWLRQHDIKPLIAISLQNTNFYLSEPCPNYIYYHQSIPFYNVNWSPFKRKERLLWFYKHIYPFFVKLFINSRTEVFVQLEFIRDGFARKFNFDEDKIHVVFPNAEEAQPEVYDGLWVDEKALNLFYPAAYVVHKNHQILIDALTLFDQELVSPVVLYLTIEENDLKLDKTLKNIRIECLGKITYGQVIWMYQQVDALVFPSYIETLGLPLIEAASQGLPIIASDLEYSREVLQGYKGVTFVPFDDAWRWGQVIKEFSSGTKSKFEPYVRENTRLWKVFFDIIKKHL